MSVITLGASITAFALEAVPVAALEGFHDHIGVMEVRPARPRFGCGEAEVRLRVLAGVYDGGLIADFTLGARVE